MVYYPSLFSRAHGKHLNQVIEIRNPDQSDQLSFLTLLIKAV